MTTIDVRDEDWAARRRALGAAALLLPIALTPGWVALAAGLGAPRPLQSLTGLVLVALLVVAVATDAAYGKIYNWLVYPMAAWAVAINLSASWMEPGGTIVGLTAPPGAVGLGPSLLGGLACFAAMFVAFLSAGGGGGDVKLATAIGLLLGPERGLMALVYTYLAAAAGSLIYLVILGGPTAARWAFAGGPASGIAPAPARELFRRKVRMAPFFAVGTLAAVLEGGLR